MYGPGTSGKRAIAATLVMITITMVLAVVLYFSVGGCYYEGPHVVLTYRNADITPSELLDAISAWNRTTHAHLMSQNASDASGVLFEFSCDGMAGNGFVHVTPRGGGPNSVVDVELYATSMRPRPYDQWRDPFGPSVDQTFAGDQARLEPCVQEFRGILSSVFGGPPDSEDWSRLGLC